MKLNLCNIAAVGLSLLMLGSCNIYKKFELPTEDNPLMTEYAQALQEEEDSTALGNLDWRTVFTDPVLQDLIAMALENNNDLEQSRLNVEIANAQLCGAKLCYLPSVAFAPQGTLNKFHMDGAEWSKTYTLPLAVSWEVDVFAKLLNNKRGAEVGVYRAEAYEQAVRSQIIAAVAQTYYSIATLQSQLTLMRQTAAIWERNIQTMRDLKLAGRVTEAAVVQSEAQYYSILAQITDVEAGLVQANNAMSMLQCVMPRAWAVPANASLSLPSEFSRGVPMRQLASRPDVRAAELGLAAAYYSTNSARAAFYPSFNISSNGGLTNSLGSMIMNPGKWFIALAAQLTAPIFTRGQLTTQLNVAKIRQEQAMLTFESTLFNAAADISTALASYQKNVEKAGYLEQQAADMALAVDYTQELLNVGGYNTTYLEVLTAQQQLLAVQMAALSCRQAQASAIINLYQNLGGGRK